MLDYTEAHKHFEYKDGVLYRKISNNRGKIGTAIGYHHPNGYIYVPYKDKQYRAHRVIWLMFHGCNPKIMIDHINGNRADNRIENLRECSNGENQQNRKLNKNSSTGFIGVSKWKDKFKAEIRFNKKGIYLGLFPTAEEAHRAYLKKKAELHTFNPTVSEKA